MNEARADQLRVKGAWWDIAQPDIRCPGELRIDAAGEVTVELESIALKASNELIGIAHEPFASATYHGHDIYGESISLFGCVRGSHQRAAAYVKRARSASVAVKGVHRASLDEVMMDNVTVNFTYLQEWLCTQRLKRAEDSPGRIVLEKPSMEERVYTTEQGFAVVIRPSIGSSSHEQEESFSFENCIDLRFEQPTSLRRITEIVNDMQWFLTLAMGKTAGILELRGTLKGLNHGDTDFPQIIEVYRRWRGPANGGGLHDRWDMLFTVEDLSSGLGAALDRWREYRTRHESVLSCYFSTLFNRHLYSNHEFLFLAHALELYHLINFDGARQPKEEYATRVDDIVALVPAEADWLRARLENANRKTLADRLRELLKKQSAVLGDFIPDHEQFVALVKHTRNYYTHYTPKTREKIAEGVELLKLITRMRGLLECIFLQDLDAPATAVEKVLGDDRAYVPAP